MRFFSFVIIIFILVWLKVQDRTTSQQVTEIWQPQDTTICKFFSKPFRLGNIYFRSANSFVGKQFECDKGKNSLPFKLDMSSKKNSFSYSFSYTFSFSPYVIHMYIYIYLLYSPYTYSHYYTYVSRFG